MLGREDEREASRWSRVEPGSCFSRYVGGMIIEDQLDRGAGRISGVETLEEFDELSAAVAVSDERMNLPGKQVDSGQQAKRAMTFGRTIRRICTPPLEYAGIDRLVDVDVASVIVNIR